MKNHKVEILIWIIVLIIIICAFGYIYHNKFVKPNVYNIEFQDIDGVIKGSPVRFMGVTIGHVRNLTYNDENIIVQIIVTKKGIEIPGGTGARVEFSGLAGSKSIELTPPDDSCSVGIISQPTFRVKDLLDAFKYMGDAFQALEQFMKKTDHNSILKVITAIPTKNDLKPIDNFINHELPQTQEQINSAVKEIIKSERDIQTTIENMIKNVQKLNSFLKK